MAILKDLIVQSAARIIGPVYGNSFVKAGGTASQFLKADGSVDSNVYITSASVPSFAALGSTTKPVYLSGTNTFSACSTYAGGTAVTLNGTSKAASAASFYAPESAGTSGQYLKSTGSGAPTWETFPTIPTVNDATLTVKGDGTYTSVGTGNGGDTFTANASSAKTITVNHNTRSETTTTSSSAPDLTSSTQSNRQITIVTPTFDEAGHETGKDTKTVTFAQITAASLGLTDIMHFKGAVSSLPAAATTDSYNNGDVIIVTGTNKEYVRSGKTSSAAGSWIELGDEGSYAQKTITVSGDGTYIGGGGDLTQNRTISHLGPGTSGADITAGSSVGNNTTTTLSSGGTFIVPYFSYNAKGHITASGTKTLTLPSDNDNFGTVYVQTAAATAAKTATVPWTYTLRTGNTFILYLKTTNTSTSATLSINSTTAKSVRIDGAAPTSSNWAAGTYLCYYDGTYYQMYTNKNPYNYNDLINKPATGVTSITTVAGAHTAQTSATGAVSFNVPTKTSHLTNDSGLLTAQGIKGLVSSTSAQTAPGSTAVAIAGSGNITLHKVAWTGTYSDLIGTPTIPAAANDANINVSNGTTSVTLTSTNSSTARTLKITGSKGITIGTPSIADNVLTVDISHSHTDIDAATNVGGNTDETPDYNNTFSVPYFSYDAQGHITGSGTKTVKIPASDNVDKKVTPTDVTNTTAYRVLLAYSTTYSSNGQPKSTANITATGAGTINAKSYVKTGATTTNILLAGGGDTDTIDGGTF